jgi:hypothetical protein
MTTTPRHDGEGIPASLDRRGFLAGAAALAVSGTALIHAREAWGLEVKALKPDTMATLIAVARDIYPHDRLADRFYAVAVKSFDDKAAADPKMKAMIENGIADLDARARKAFGTPRRPTISAPTACRRSRPTASSTNGARATISRTCSCPTAPSSPPAAPKIRR